MLSLQTRIVIVALYVVGLISVSAWMLFTGQFTDALNGIYAFIANPDMKNVLSGREAFFFLTKLLAFKIWISIVICFAVLFLVILFGGRLPDKNNDDMLNELAKRNLFGFFSRLLGFASIEEFYFRWFPLAILFPLWGDHSLLWLFVIGSSAIFAFVHIFNETGLSQRIGRIPFTIGRFAGGLILSYVFLVFGLATAISFHAFFNFILIFPFWLIKRGYLISAHPIEPKIITQDNATHPYFLVNPNEDPFERYFAPEKKK